LLCLLSRLHTVFFTACCSVLQCVAVRYTVLQCVAVCCSVLQRVAVSQQRCLTASAVEISAGSLVFLHCNTLQHTATHCNTLQHTATHCNKTVSVFWSTSFCVVPVDSRMQRSSICRSATLQHIVTLQHCTLQHCKSTTQRSICRGTTLQRLCRTATSCRTATLAHSAQHVAARHCNNTLSHCNSALCNIAHRHTELNM